MKFYQQINIDNYDIIISKVKTYLEKKSLIDTMYAGYIPLDTNELIGNCPELVRSLFKMGLTINGAAIYRTTDNSQSPVHIDHVTYQCRINIPIIGCEQSSTVYYNADIDNTLEQPWNKTKYVKCINAVEIARVTVDRPTILRVNAPHRVEMNKFNSLRICLTIRCTPDPVTLFTE
jgi:hypothetical protein